MKNLFSQKKKKKKNQESNPNRKSTVKEYLQQPILIKQSQALHATYANTMLVFPTIVVPEPPESSRSDLAYERISLA